MFPSHQGFPRVPSHCPPGFSGRYTVVPGDTMFFVAQRFGVSLEALIAANPHITNPSLIFPGDVLCVPAPVPPPPPPKKEPCPCPATLRDFVNRFVEVTTSCGTVSGKLVFVGDSSIALQQGKSGNPIVVSCSEICCVRVPRYGPREE